MKKVIIYDKDGTLLDYHKIWIPYAHRCISDFIDEFEINDDPKELAETFGIRDGEIMPNSVIASGTGKDIHHAFEGIHEGGGKWAKAYYENSLDELHDNMVLIDGAVEALKTGQKLGYTNMILTSDSRQSTLNFIKKFELEEYISEIVCGDDTPYSKPDIRVLQDQIEAGLNLKEVVMVGDNSADTLLGKDEGVTTIGVLSGTCESVHLEGADHIVDSVKDLFKDGKFILDES
ncbi:HAD family hydrolase [Phocicoccus pinnipedialis]|uniref:Pyrophosphatase PpaX n=1 Tax=Phocicoccus pinnipedialis TaxID=110845 RepID=A0A6V7R4S8_9BACL|nr:HAD family hydrolase [Jeotgalicoccus pinnipedialis]MBP1940044.1 HAD superfamily hydrolase (TIGR01549 family) [Jeotgalicoccus pinnipedialis]CAD2072008.1 Pyrophosphatase PpaX [Jeotgalicoccus pinnipedialis]